MVFSRSRHLTPAHISELRDRRRQSVLIRTLMQNYPISKATVYRYPHLDAVPVEESVAVLQ